MAWIKTIVIDENIEKVWSLFNEDNYKRIMPQVVSHKLLSEDGNTKVYEEVYREGKREETYLLTEALEQDTTDVKHSTFSFTIANMIESEGIFLLEKIDDQRTKFTYSGDNQGKNFFMKTMLKLASKKNDEKVVNEFMERVLKESTK